MLMKSCDGNVGEKPAACATISRADLETQRQRPLDGRIGGLSVHIHPLGGEGPGLVSLVIVFLFLVSPFQYVLGCQPQESVRVISTARLHVSPRFDLPPIDVVVFNDPQ